MSNENSNMLEEFGTAYVVKDKTYWKKHFRSIPGICLHSDDPLSAVLDPIKQVDSLKVPGKYHIWFMKVRSINGDKSRVTKMGRYDEILEEINDAIEEIELELKSEDINLEKA